jgi:hypothetical protein
MSPLRAAGDPARYNGTMLPRMVALACGLTALAVSAGCASARAEAVTPLPDLLPPEAPPRVVAEYLPDPPLPAAPVSTEAVVASPSAARPPRRGAPRADAANDDPPPARPQAPNQPSLAMAPAGANAKADQSVRSLLAQAARDLERVTYATLDADGRAQYDTARRFMQQADEALRARNVVFAGKLADKAAAMASVLVR